jgi:hypothetical protein
MGGAIERAFARPVGSTHSTVLALVRDVARRANQLISRQRPVQCHQQKYFHSRFTQITFTIRPVPPLSEGRLAIVTDARRDAVDASGASDEGALLADGEVVWS